MLPLRDENPTHSFPVLTLGLIAANVAVFLLQLSLGLNLSVFLFGLIPAEVMQSADRIYSSRLTGLPPGTGLQNFDPAWVTVLSSMFMHGSFMHILGNMWFLWIFGNNVEDELGKGRFLLFYLLCGLGAAAAQMAVGPDSPIPMVGASGALAGVMGAYLVLFPGSRILCLTTTLVITTLHLPAWVVLGFWFVLQVLEGLIHLGPRAAMGGVAYAAHVGGFVVGWLLIRLLAPGGRRPRRRFVPRPDIIDWR
ncbi:MAG: rhomboid family intramembrane serine protease [Armatimonadetes bacterium]|nr:rhomboid family intramembrane serine protease [Armatimonadota bacterium]